MTRIKKLLLVAALLVPSFAHAVSCETFAAGDTDYVAKLNLLAAGCSPTSNPETSLPRAAAGGMVDAITATFSPAITLADKTIVAVVSAGANTSTTPSFTPNGLTTHTIVTRGGGALAAGDIGAAGFVALLEYNLAGTRWELMNPAGSTATGTVTNISGNLDAAKLVLANNGSDITTSAGITSDGTSQIELGVAGSAVGSAKFRNATSGSITLQPASGALGTRTITMPATTGTMALTSDIIAPTLTATHIGYGDGSNLLTGSSELTYTSASAAMVMNKGINATAYIAATNPTIDTAAAAMVGASNDAGAYIRATKFGTGFSTNGLLTASLGYFANDSGATLFLNNAVTDFIWSRGGFAAINEVARLGAGTLSLGVAGTTVGALKLNNATSGSITIQPTTGALGTINYTAPAVSGTLALSSSALTSGRVPFVTTGGALTDTSTFTWSGSALAVPGTITASTNTAGGLATSGTSAGNISITAGNASTGTGAGTQLALANSANSIYVAKLSTGYTTNGLLTAGQAYWYNETGTSLFANAASTDHIWSRGGFAATNEVMRLGAGALSLGVAGTTSGSLVLNGSTSGAATLTVPAAAGSPLISLPTLTGTLATLGGTETFTNKTLTSPTIADTSLIGNTAWTTFTPTVSAGSGTLTSASGAGRYKQIGKTVFYTIRVTITTVGSAGAGIIATLPVSMSTSQRCFAPGRDTNTGTNLSAWQFSATELIIQKYDATFTGADGSILDVSGICEAA